MSEGQYGPDRCSMSLPGTRLEKMARGGAQIRSLLDAGWVVNEGDERNHIRGDYGLKKPAENGKAETRATIGLDPVKTETKEEPVSTPERNHTQEHDRPRRPRIKSGHLRIEKNNN